MCAVVRGVLLRSWAVVGTDDVNGDGMSDLLWQNTISSQVSVWEMNGTSVLSAVAPTTPGSGWQLKNDGPIPADQMGAAGAADASGGTMHLSAPDGANGTGGVNASGLPSNFAASMEGLGAAQLTLATGTTVAYSLHVGA